MAARKLQTEIDRTLKKVSEGVELFEGIYEKMQASTNQTQKEKLEADLKTQIKKLQRLRDQIKTWVASADIKDKTQLVDNRKLIETQMEKFKACEKEMKTKAFSKEGLTQTTKLDPKAREREELIGWVSTHIGTLEQQVEAAEAEIENLQGAGKKKKGNASTRLDELEKLNDGRKWHLGRLEIVLRLLINGSLATERVNALKEDISYFVESNAEDGFDLDEGIYDELNLDEEEEQFNVPNDGADYNSIADSEVASEDIPPRTPARKQQHDEESVTSSKDSPVLKKAATTLPSRRPTVDHPKPAPAPPNPNFAQQPMSSILKAGLPSPASRPPIQNPPLRYAAAVTATNGTPTSIAPSSTATERLPQHSPTQSVAQQSPDANPPSAAPTVPPIPQEQVAPSPSLTHESVSAASPILSSAASAHPESSIHDSPAMSEAVESVVSEPLATSSPQPASSVNASVSSPQVNVSPHRTDQLPPRESPVLNINGAGSSNAGPSHMPQQYPPGVLTPGAGTSTPPSAVQQAQYSTGIKPPPGLIQESQNAPGPQDQILAPGVPSAQSQAQQRNIAPSAFPGSLQDLVVSFENVKQKAAQRMTNLDSVNKLLEGGYATMPQPRDTEKPKYYVPRHPYQTSPYYPQQPAPLLSSPNLFSQLDVETLFYVFYYLPGTYQQFLAAKELKKQSWRFHIKYLTWFQRHSEPQAITEEYEQGVYVYFDWEGSWCQRKKSDFRFEYRYLSED